MVQIVSLIFFVLLLLYPVTSKAMCEYVGGYQQGNDGWHYDGQKLEGADPSSFHIFSTFQTFEYSPCDNNVPYAADKTHVWLGATPLPGVDVATFSLNGSAHTPMDKSHVYSGAAILPGADPATFVSLGSGYAKDATHVFYFAAQLEGADPKTFRQIAPGWFKDASHVYLQGRAIKDIDAKSFTIVGAGVAHDATNVFFYSSIVPGADPNDIKLLGGEYWSSGHKVFAGGKLLPNADKATFQVPRSGGEFAFTAQDKNNFFLRDNTYPKSECRQVGEVILACNGYILNSGFKSTQMDSASLHYLGRFPVSDQTSRLCPFIENSMIYQDNRGIYSVGGGSLIMQFPRVPPNEKFDVLDKPLEDMLCAWPPTGWR